MRAKREFTCAAASLTGHASNVTGAAWTITTAKAGDGMAHQATVRNDSATDHSLKTIVLSGGDADGNAQTETIAAPAGSATVTSTKFWGWLDTATPSATIGADTFDIGWAAAAVSPWLHVDWKQKPFSARVAVNIGGTINYDLEHTSDLDLPADAFYFTNADIDGKTTDAETIYTAPVAAVRARVNSHTAGTIALHVLQAERN